jgi:hypothetical protein
MDVTDHLELRDELSRMSESPCVRVGKVVRLVFLRIDVKVDHAIPESAGGFGNGPR